MKWRIVCLFVLITGVSCVLPRITTAADDPLAGVDDAVNLLKNGNFDEVVEKDGQKLPLHWKLPKGHLSKEAYSEPFSVKVLPRDGHNKLRQTVELDPGKEYFYSVWIKGPRGTHLWVQYEGVGGWHAQIRAGRGDGWRHRRQAFRVPEESNGTTTFVLDRPQHAEGELYFDDAAIVSWETFLDRKRASVKADIQALTNKEVKEDRWDRTLTENLRQLKEKVESGQNLSLRQLVQMEQKVAQCRGLLRLEDVKTSATSAEKAAGVAVKALSPVKKFRPRIDRQLLEAEELEQVHAARRERASVQLALMPFRKGEFRLNAHGFGALNVSFAAIRNVLTISPDGYLPTTLEEGWVPDPLVPLKEGDTVSVQPGKPRFIWCTIEVPEDAEAGTYTGEVQISPQRPDGKTASVSLDVKVFDFSLPEIPSLYTRFGFRPDLVRRFYGASPVQQWHTGRGGQQSQDSREGDYCLKLPKGGSVTQSVNLDPDREYVVTFWTRTSEGASGGSPHFFINFEDVNGWSCQIRTPIQPEWHQSKKVFSVADEASGRGSLTIVNRLKKGSLYIDEIEVKLRGADEDQNLLSNGGFENGRQRKWRIEDYDELIEEYFALLTRRRITPRTTKERFRHLYAKYDTSIIPAPRREALPGFRKFLDETNVKNRKILAYMADEPSPGDYPEIKKRAQKYRKAFPEAALMVCEGPSEEAQEVLGGVVDIWVPHYGFNDPESRKELRARGEKLWLYVSNKPARPNVFVNNSGVEHRMMPWVNWRTDTEGILYWGIACWPYNLGWDREDWKSHRRWLQEGWQLPPGGQKGSGWLVYPGPDGPYSSVRLEMLSDGMQDFEYFARLEELYKEKKQRLPGKMRRRVSELLSIPSDIMEGQTTFPAEGTDMLDYRVKLGKMIEKVQAVE